MIVRGLFHHKVSKHDRKPEGIKELKSQFDPVFFVVKRHTTERYCRQRSKFYPLNLLMERQRQEGSSCKS
ncbi:hypothetical protein RO3G_08270 [Rhizopus delemar RA 99-880]|uniref:Uncharacterized protein n=1 Tax=Rhizopus delemar (strain RA 99-880 / ATCC MYA-4621 / FGSC 9543 / NRRL 43880) TaxID=246409 RepID=I1C535_RHIO9|nr:hypothetical protein RO3G_08270 [Rhizopus delemar RA 99-880]|eukprot:EIE83565.1 hypothetical protein RO3G_08270 [Rhizopus delemar RA 99-880]